MKIARFDRDTCRLVGNAIEAALKKVGEDFGVHIVRKGGTYNEHSYTLKLEIACISKDGTIQNKEAEAFKMFASQYDLSPDDFGKVFMGFSGDSYEISGLSTRSFQYPILAKSKQNGKTFKFSSTQVKEALARVKR